MKNASAQPIAPDMSSILLLPMICVFIDHSHHDRKHELLLESITPCSSFNGKRTC